MCIPRYWCYINTKVNYMLPFDAIFWYPVCKYDANPMALFISINSKDVERDEKCYPIRVIVADRIPLDGAKRQHGCQMLTLGRKTSKIATNANQPETPKECHLCSTYSTAQCTQYNRVRKISDYVWIYRNVKLAPSIVFHCNFTLKRNAWIHSD